MRLIGSLLVGLAVPAALAAATLAWQQSAASAAPPTPGGPVFYGELRGAIEFARPHAGGNGRACATCHRLEDAFALSPATVEARFQRLQQRRRHDPAADDPLFRAIDADDWADDFTTLRRKALVRVVRPLPPNVRLADDPTATTVAVWRAVPTVANAALTAPYQAEGRLATLEAQAAEAMRMYSQTPSGPPAEVTARLADFQRHLFTSRRVARLASRPPGDTAPDTTIPPLGALEAAGKATFERFCTRCHGGPAMVTSTDARFLPVPQRGPQPGTQDFVNLFVQTPRPPGPFFAGLPSAELPEREYLVTLPDGSVRSVVTSDPGRGLVSGDLRDFGRFDVPTLFGIRLTAPYFHDHSAATLEDVVAHYQALFRFMQSADETQALCSPPGPMGDGRPPGCCGFAPIPDADIPGLVAFLRRL